MVDLSQNTKALAAVCPCVKQDPQWCPLTHIVSLSRPRGGGPASAASHAKL